MARASVKIDVATELLTINQERVQSRVETHWDEDAAAREDRRAKGLQDQPYDVARELGRSKHGTLLLISRWEALGEAVAANQGLDEVQIQMAYDLLAIPKVLRNGSRQVPAADNAPALSALVNRELARHRTRLERSLNAADESDRELRGSTSSSSATASPAGSKPTSTALNVASRGVRMPSIASAREWTQQQLLILTPRRPSNPPRPPRPLRNRNRNRHRNRRPPKPPPPTPPTSPEAQPESPQRPLPKDCSEEDQEMLRIIAEAIAESLRPSGGAQPPTDEPGPVPPG